MISINDISVWVSKFQLKDWIDLLKGFGVLIGGFVTFSKYFSGTKSVSKSDEIKFRYERLRVFLSDGGANQQSLLVEQGFGAAMGHTKLTAPEIKVILNKDSPSNFIESYLKARNYIKLNNAGDGFELTSIASKPIRRALSVWAGVLFYALFLIAAVWLLFSVIPLFVKVENYFGILESLVMTVYFVVLAIFSLKWAGRINSAVKLIEGESSFSWHTNKVKI